MKFTPRQLLYAMLDDIDDENIKILCQLIGNLKLSEEITQETLQKAFTLESDLFDFFEINERKEE